MASLVHLPVQPLGWGLVAVVMGLVSLLLFNSGRSSSCFACLFAFVGGAFVTTLNREYATGAPPADYMKYDAVVMSTPQRHGKVSASTPSWWMWQTAAFLLLWLRSALPVSTPVASALAAV